MKANPAPPWSIGHLATRFGIETHVLRHWEDEGLLAPLRNASGYRQYGENDAVRVATILHQRALGIPVPVIRVLLGGDAADRHGALAQHLDHIDAQISALQVARDMTEHAMACRAHDIAECGTFANYVADILAGRSPEALEASLRARPRNSPPRA